MNTVLRSSALKIGSRTYSIATIDDETFDSLLAQRRVYDSDIKSFVDYDDQVIFVRASIARDHRRELVLHELLHACFEDAGTHDDNLERFIAVLSPRLVQLVDQLASVLDEST